jgi:hypothetical protein
MLCNTYVCSILGHDSDTRVSHGSQDDIQRYNRSVSQLSHNGNAATDLERSIGKRLPIALPLSVFSKSGKTSKKRCNITLHRSLISVQAAISYRTVVCQKITPPKYDAFRTRTHTHTHCRFLVYAVVAAVDSS